MAVAGHQNLAPNIRVDPLEPTGQPARFVSIRRRIANTIFKNGFGRRGEAFHGLASGYVLFHSFEYLQQAPTLPGVTLRGKNTFTFEVHIIDQGVAAARRGGDSFEAFLDLGLVWSAGFREHFRQRRAQTLNEKFRLEIDGARKKSA